MTNLDSIFKSRDITLPTKVHLVKAMVFPVVMPHVCLPFLNRLPWTYSLVSYRNLQMGFCPTKVSTLSVLFVFLSGCWQGGKAEKAISKQCVSVEQVTQDRSPQPDPSILKTLASSVCALVERDVLYLADTVLRRREIEKTFLGSLGFLQHHSSHDGEHPCRSRQRREAPPLWAGPLQVQQMWQSLQEEVQIHGAVESSHWRKTVFVQ